MQEERLNIIISGGGTGGHIFPALSIADALQKIYKDKVNILFVGADGRMEMQRVPSAGYPIKGLPICGFDRKNLLKNFIVFYKIIKSQWLARRIIKDFHPHVAVGVGGYASGPMLKTAAIMGIPTLIQEQNSYAGVTNKILSKKAARICVAYEGMERFFDKKKILLTGNPVRQELIYTTINKIEATRAFNLDPNKQTILIVGGSLGARTINESILNHIDLIKRSNIQFIWQTGKIYHNEIKQRLESFGDLPMLHVTDFIANMGLAYTASSLVISRAGAGSISEFCILKKPVILVPSPNVAEDHQTKNAMALVKKNAAILIRDNEAKNSLIKTAIESISNKELLESLSINISTMAFNNAADTIAEEVYKLAISYKAKVKKQ